MAAISTVLAIGSLVVAAGSAYASYSQNQKAARAQREQRNIALAENAARKDENIRAQVRQERVKRAQILQASENSGTTMSSGSIGGQSMLSTQVGNNIGAISRADETSTSMSFFGQAAVDASSRASTFGQLTNLAKSSATFFGSQPGAQADFAKWFNSGTKTGINPTPQGT